MYISLITISAMYIPDILIKKIINVSSLKNNVILLLLIILDLYVATQIELILFYNK